MNALRLFIFLFIISFCAVHSENLPKYKLVDLGVFGSDGSHAHEINESGQVLGFCWENNISYLFLWDEVKGLTIIDYPSGKFENGKLNNKGQIAGVFLSQVDSTYIRKVMFWDANHGFWELESSKAHVELIDFNDNGQVLGSIQEQGDNQIIIWDHGKKINLTALFRQKILGKWNSFKASTLNNQGHVILTGYNLAENSQNHKYRFFIWKDGEFSPILPEIEKANHIQAVYLDDDENMIISLDHNNYFINQSKLMCIPCSGCYRIINGIPVAVDCLSSVLKKDRHGNSYFFEGIRIKKLIKEEFPYFNVNDYTDISDQNSKGYVVGSVDTLYGRHAFLAIPEVEK